jgi:hypothetical protein
MCSKTLFSLHLHEKNKNTTHIIFSAFKTLGSKFCPHLKSSLEKAQDTEPVV